MDQFHETEKLHESSPVIEKLTVKYAKRAEAGSVMVCPLSAPCLNITK